MCIAPTATFNHMGASSQAHFMTDSNLIDWFTIFFWIFSCQNKKSSVSKIYALKIFTFT